MILKHIEFYIPHRSGEKREKFEKKKKSFGKKNQLWYQYFPPIMLTMDVSIETSMPYRIYCTYRCRCEYQWAIQYSLIIHTLFWSFFLLFSKHVYFHFRFGKESKQRVSTPQYKKWDPIYCFEWTLMLQRVCLHCGIDQPGAINLK